MQVMMSQLDYRAIGKQILPPQSSAAPPRMRLVDAGSRDAILAIQGRPSKRYVCMELNISDCFFLQFL